MRRLRAPVTRRRFLTRHPLDSPDVLGLAAGAYTGALIVLTAAVVYLLDEALVRQVFGLDSLVFPEPGDRHPDGRPGRVTGIVAGAVRSSRCSAKGRSQAR